MLKHSQIKQHGWCSFDGGEQLQRWVDTIAPLAQQTLAAPEHQQWWRHGATWFAGVNVLPNDGTGKVSGGLPLPQQLCSWVKLQTAMRAQESVEWEPGQLSVLRPGYPRRDTHESEAAHRFRLNRDAAHVDGLLPVGDARRRMPREFHRFILGIPLQRVAAHVGPTVVWQGSHVIMQRALESALRDIPEHLWPQTDVSDVYQQTRRAIFAQCKRVEIHVPPGSCYLIHRLAVHGVAPWAAQDGDENALRSVVFFRPEMDDRLEWLTGHARDAPAA